MSKEVAVLVGRRGGNTEIHIEQASAKFVERLVGILFVGLARIAAVRAKAHVTLGGHVNVVG